MEEREEMEELNQVEEGGRMKLNKLLKEVKSFRRKEL